MPRPTRDLTAVLAGVVAALVGFSSSFVVVLSGLSAVGATPVEAASGLVALCVAQALGMSWLALRHRLPLSLAWSTPGAALLVSTGGTPGGWSAAVGAFLVAAVLVLLTALLPRMGDLVAAIPVPLARAMLAGVLLPLCVEPVRALGTTPLLVAPVVLTWLVLLRTAPRWAVPAALLVALAVVLVSADRLPGLGAVLPALRFTTPSWSVSALIGIAVPLYVVTMASQNVPGAAVMKSLGYRVPWRESMTVTGVGSLLVAPLGGHAINLAAITAALTAGPQAGADRTRRWPASLSAAATYVVLAAACPAVTALVAAAPDGVVQSAAGLALLGTLAASLREALEDERDRVPAIVSLVVAASGTSVLGVGAAFWALASGLLVRGVLHHRPTSGEQTPTAGRPGKGRPAVER